MEDFKDFYGILALAAAQEDNRSEEDLAERKDFIGRLEIILQTVKSKILKKRDSAIKNLY